MERASGAAIGECAFKEPPDADGVVEFDYRIDESHRCRGYASDAADALTEFAFTVGRVRIVRAHTKAENGPSLRVLEKCGFERLGKVIDPEVGPVLRWDRVREVAVP